MRSARSWSEDRLAQGRTEAATSLIRRYKALGRWLGTGAFAGLWTLADTASSRARLLLALIGGVMSRQ